MGLKRKSGAAQAWLRDRISVVAVAMLDRRREANRILRDSEERSRDCGAERTEAPIYRDVLARLRGLQNDDEADIVAELAGMFLEDARSGLQTVEEALQKGDAPTIETVAHKLKGGSGNIGAGGLVGLFTRLEEMGASGDLSAGFELLERLQEELGKVDLALAAEVNGDGGKASGSAQAKWFQPDNPLTGSSPRLKTTSLSVISPIIVRGISTSCASASRTGSGAEIRSS